MSQRRNPTLSEMMRELECSALPLELGSGGFAAHQLFTKVALEVVLRGALEALGAQQQDATLKHLAQLGISAIHADRRHSSGTKRHAAMQMIDLFDVVGLDSTMNRTDVLDLSLDAAMIEDEYPVSVARSRA